MYNSTHSSLSDGQAISKCNALCMVGKDSSEGLSYNAQRIGQENFNR